MINFSTEILTYYKHNICFLLQVAKLDRKKDKQNITLVVVLESPKFPKGPILTAIGFNSLMTLVK